MSLTCTMIRGDCLQVMPELPPAPFYLVDPPYALPKRECTAFFWDTPFDMPSLWNIVLAKGMPFSLALFCNIPLLCSFMRVASGHFKHDMIWQKNYSTGWLLAKKRPLRKHEIIGLFASRNAIYNSARLEKKIHRNDHMETQQAHYNKPKGGRVKNLQPFSFPSSILNFASENRMCRGTKKTIHPSQKPCDLYMFLIDAYTNPGCLVIDPVAGSSTTAVAGLSSGRSVVCIEKDPDYFEAGVERVRKHIADNHIDAKVEVRT